MIKAAIIVDSTNMLIKALEGAVQADMILVH